MPATPAVDFETLPPLDESPLAVGDVVTLHELAATRTTRGVMFRITAVPGGRARYYVADPVKGGRGIKGDRTIFVKETDPARLAQAQEQTAAAATTADLTLGSVVRFAAPRRTAEEGAFVVVKVGAAGFNLARLGGDGGRYYTNIPGTALAPVPADAITVR